MSLEAIEQLTKDYAAARARLEDHVGDLQKAIEAIKARRAKRLKALIGETVEAEAILRAMIEDCPECFKRPKAHVFNGIKVGYKKGKGSLTWKNLNSVISRIRTHLPRMAETLIRTKYEPDKQALGKLTGDELKKIGVKVGDDSDVVLIKPVEGAMEKTVNALIKEAAGKKGAA
jgi:phage host-nuclease inhibitor protein Gam